MLCDHVKHFHDTNKPLCHKMSASFSMSTEYFSKIMFSWISAVQRQIHFLFAILRSSSVVVTIHKSTNFCLIPQRHSIDTSYFVFVFNLACRCARHKKGPFKANNNNNDNEKCWYSIFRDRNEMTKKAPTHTTYSFTP